MIPRLASGKYCTGCLACVDTCKLGAINFCIKEDGHLYPVVTENKCIDCGQCTNVCIGIDDKYKTYQSHGRSTPFAGWSLDDIGRQNSASGGIFYALACYVISVGGYVIGAVLEKNEVKLVSTNEIECVKKMQNSKYQQPNTAGIYEEAKSILEKGYKLLFTGAPCHIAALFLYLRKRTYNNLITCDFICSGYPSLLPIKKTIAYFNPEAEIKSFRDKTNGWKNLGFIYELKLNCNNVVINCGSHNLTTAAFSSGLTQRYSCTHCQLCFSSRKSDLTIGDFWGEKRFAEQQRKGISLIIVHTPAIVSLIAKAKCFIQESSWEECLPYNPRIIDGKRRYVCFSPSRLFMVWLFRKNTYRNLCNFYYGETNVVNIFYKLYCKMTMYIHEYFSKRVIVFFLKANKNEN